MPAKKDVAAATAQAPAPAGAPAPAVTAEGEDTVASLRAVVEAQKEEMDELHAHMAQLEHTLEVFQERLEALERRRYYSRPARGLFRRAL